MTIIHSYNTVQQQTLKRQVSDLKRRYKGLYDVWQEHSTNDGKTMNIKGFKKALEVFGMVIESQEDELNILPNLIFSRFKRSDNEKEKEITCNDFIATMISFVLPTTDQYSLQTLFDIFDLSQSGYLQTESIARLYVFPFYMNRFMRSSLSAFRDLHYQFVIHLLGRGYLN